MLSGTCCADLDVTWTVQHPGCWGWPSCSAELSKLGSPGALCSCSLVLGDGTGIPALRPCLLKPRLRCLQELWRLSYPLHTKNTVPAWAVPVLSTCGPALVRQAR